MIKDVTKPYPTFEMEVPIKANISETNIFVAIGSSGGFTPAQPPFILMQENKARKSGKLQYSMPLSGPSLGVVEGGVDAVIFESFGEEPPAPKTPPKNGGKNAGDAMTAAAAAKLPVIMVVALAVATLFV